MRLPVSVQGGKLVLDHRQVKVCPAKPIETCCNQNHSHEQDQWFFHAPALLPGQRKLTGAQSGVVGATLMWRQSPLRQVHYKKVPKT